MHDKGTYTIDMDQDVILSVLKGAWSEQTALRYSEALHELVLTRQPGFWANIIILESWELGVPAIEPILNQLVEWCFEHGVRKSAQVYPFSPLKKFQIDNVLGQRDPNNSRQFNSLEISIEWLDKQGYEVTDGLKFKAQRSMMAAQ